MSIEDDIRRLAADIGSPSKRRNKIVSGRQGRKTFQGKETLRRAGGTSDLVGCMLEGPEGVFRDLCHTVPSDTGYRDGKPWRPAGERSSGAQRGQ